MKRNFAKPKRLLNKHYYINHFRIIVAGGRTGSFTVFMGEQLNHTNGEIVYLDVNTASINIAQKRTKITGLRNIIWVHNWIEGVRFLGMGSFEELHCSCVLHHIKFPSYGLNILKDTLSEHGGMGLMVYGKYGRTSVYQMKDFLKMANTYQSGIDRELNTAIYILHILPVRTWFILNPVVGDHKKGKIGLYDLLLHKRDVAFSIETLFQWITNSGLYFLIMITIKQDFIFKLDRSFLI